MIRENRRHRMTPHGKVYFTEDEEVARDAEEAEWAAEADNRLAAEERKKRDELLAETDHYALSDVTMSDAMATYRQALRDVPQQTDFPTSITWPTKP